MPTLLWRYLAVSTVLILGASEGQGQEIALQRGTIVRFASVEEGAAVLSQEDVYTRNLSQFDLHARLNTVENVTSDDLRRFAAAQVEPWKDEEVKTLQSCLASLRRRLQDFVPLFPETVLLIKTTGREEGEAAYCRQNAIVLPRAMLRRPPEALERLLAHELFHILSRQDPNRQRRLYAIVGFQPCGEIELPPSLRDRKITNPDAPLLNYVIELQVEGQAKLAIPVLFSSVERFDPAAGKTFFQYLQFRLLQVERHGNTWRAAEGDEGPILLDPQKTPSYHEQIGRNTSYIIHPEEVLAENFAHLLLETPDLPTPRIVDEMRRLLTDTQPLNPDAQPE